MCFFHRWGTERQVNIIPASWVYNNGRCPEGRGETASRGVHAFLVLFIARTPSRALHHATMTPWLQLSIRLSSLECLRVSRFSTSIFGSSLSLSLSLCNPLNRPQTRSRIPCCPLFSSISSRSVFPRPSGDIASNPVRILVRTTS